MNKKQNLTSPKCKLLPTEQLWLPGYCYDYTPVPFGENSEGHSKMNFQRQPDFEESLEISVINKTNTKTSKRKKGSNANREYVQKGRKRKFTQTRAERKANKYMNIPYITCKNKQVLPKEFQDYDCKCKLNCAEKVSIFERMQEFDSFHSLGTHSSQSLFILERVLEIPKKRTYVKVASSDHQRTYSRIYHINNIRVCKPMFVRTLNISSGRVNTVLNKIRHGDGLSDMRGVLTGGHNKIPSEQVKEIMDHIYSHSVPNKDGHNSTYIVQPERSLKEMYKSYISNKKCETSVSLATYKSIFYKYFKSDNSSSGLDKDMTDVPDDDCYYDVPIDSPQTEEKVNVKVIPNQIKINESIPNQRKMNELVERIIPSSNTVKNEDVKPCVSSQFAVETFPHKLTIPIETVQHHKPLPYFHTTENYYLPHLQSVPQGLNFSNTLLPDESPILCSMGPSDGISPKPTPKKPPRKRNRATGAKKGRKRKFGDKTREERRDSMYKNETYINSRNKEILPKVFEDFDCKCSLKCSEKLAADIRRKNFETFYSLGSYSAQNLFLLERCEEIFKKRSYTKNKTPEHERVFSRIYTLDDIKVCKIMFTKTLKISTSRMNTVLKKARGGQGLIDNRGAAGGHNKMPNEMRQEIVNHINGVIRKYANIQTKPMEKFQFPPGHTLKAAYLLYTGGRSKVVSFSSYKSIFYQSISKFKTKGTIDDT